MVVLVTQWAPSIPGRASDCFKKSNMFNPMTNQTLPVKTHALAFHAGQNPNPEIQLSAVTCPKTAQPHGV